MKVRYENGNTLLHSLNPVTKLTVLVLYSISVFMFDSLPVLLGSFIFMGMIVMGGRLRSIVSLMTSRFMISFAVVIFVIQVLFTRGGETYFSLPLYFFTIDVTSVGMLTGLIVMFRFITIILASGIFVATTDPNELAYSLMRAGLPYRYGFMLVTAIRFIPVFESEANTVSMAQRARGLEIDGGGMKNVIRSAKYTLMPLVVSALSKVDVLVISMEGRAFGHKRSRTFLRQGRFGVADISMIVLSIAVFIIMVLAIKLGWIALPQLSIYNN